jgi:hypothetical protein
MRSEIPLGGLGHAAGCWCEKCAAYKARVAQALRDWEAGR